MQNRLRSKVVWVSFASLLLFILKNYALLEPLQLTSEEYNFIVNLILEIFILLGILNNPKDKEKF